MANRGRTHTGFAATLAVSALFMSGGSSPTMSTADPGSTAEALRFRSDFGLAADALTIETAATDRERYSDTRWGVPLTPAESAEIERRGKVQVEIGEALKYVSGLPDFAGAYIDQKRGGLPVIQFVGTSTARGPEVRGLAPGITIEVGEAARSYDSLLAVQVEINDAWDELRASGIPIVSSGIDTQANTVVVGVERVTTDVADRITARFGPGVELREDHPASADVCTIPNCWPQKGGVWVESNAFGTDCTAGFVAKRDSNGELALVTAGHCIYVGGTGTWRHNGHNIGTTTGHTWVVGADADVAFIRMTVLPLPSVKNHLLRYDEGLAALTSVGDTSVQIKGGAVCRTGYGTGQLQGGANNGRTCGVIGEVNVTHDSCIQNNTICRAIDHTWEMKFDSVGGDSGGPVFAGVLDPDYGQGYGTHIHSTDGTGAISWYSPLGWAQAEFFNRFGVLYRFCLNTACTVTGP